MSQEKKKPEELICIRLLVAMILAGHEIWKIDDVRTSDELEEKVKQTKRELTEKTKLRCGCLVEECAMWSTFGTACGLRTR